MCKISFLSVFFFAALLTSCFAQTTETIQIDTYCIVKLVLANIDNL